MKVKTYLGFAYKSGNIILGIESLKRTKKPVYLILVADSLSENGYTQIEKLALNNNWQILKTNLLNEMFENKNVKIIGITDSNLACAIKEEYKNAR